MNQNNRKIIFDAMMLLEKVDEKDLDNFELQDLNLFKKGLKWLCNTYDEPDYQTFVNSLVFKKNINVRILDKNSLSAFNIEANK